MSIKFSNINFGVTAERSAHLNNLTKNLYKETNEPQLKVYIKIKIEYVPEQQSHLTYEQARNKKI